MNGNIDKNNAATDNELRQRLPQHPAKPQQANTVDEARKAVVELNAAEERADKDESEKRTYGRTADGTGMLYLVLKNSHLLHYSPTVLCSSKIRFEADFRWW